MSRYRRSIVLALALVAADGCNQRDQAVAQRAAHEARHDLRALSLRGKVEVAASQPYLIRTLADALPLSAAGRAQVHEQLQVLQMRIDEARDAVRALDGAPEAELAQREAAVDRLDAARADAWSALNDAPRTQRSSS